LKNSAIVFEATAFASDPDKARPVPDRAELVQPIELKEFINCHRR
jgi:hypothetical protein